MMEEELQEDEGSENGSILDRIKFSRSKKIKQKFGRIKVDVAALEKVLGEGQTHALIKKVNEVQKFKQALGMRMRKPPEKSIALFKKHLTYPGSLSDLAREEKISTTHLTYQLCRVAYYEYVVERKQLPLTPKE